MRACVFLGPTLSVADARAELDAEYLPPAMAGDVYRAALGAPQVIGIVDGRLHRVPAVWHKEALWAMTRGIHVYGSAGIGALRAAELASFGMTGIGEIFEAYRAGILEDDDEVAVAHGSADTGYHRLSEAMVDIRATLAAAAGNGVIGSSTRSVLEHVAKTLLYTERSYPAILDGAALQGSSPAELAALRDWLPGGRIDLQRQDAVAMLRAMHAHLAAGPRPKQVGYDLEHTTNWDLAARYWERKLAS